MLDGLLGRSGFSSKCKSLIKPTKTRIEVLRRREEAKQRFLKEDLVKLLSNGLDINAYGRVVKQTEEFLAGQSLLSCYTFLEQACDYIYKQLSVMQKLRECPEECREPVASLMFAAARFSDLPELRDLRDEFQDRYGNSLECFVNQVFVEKLASKPPTMEKRLQLLQDIASEYSIKWDPKAFQQRMSNPSVQTQDKSVKHGPSAGTDGKYKLPNNKITASQADKLIVRSKERIEQVARGPTLDNVRENTAFRREELNIPFVTKQEIACRTPRAATFKEENYLKGENHEIPSRGRPDFLAETHRSSKGKDNNALKTETSASSSRSRKPEYFFNHMMEADHKNENVNIDSNGKGAYNDNLSQRKPVKSKSTEEVLEEGTDKLKSSYNSVLPPPYVKLKDNLIPPPYVKPNDNGHGPHHRSKHSRSEADGSSVDPSPRIQPKPSASSDRVPKSPDHTHFKEDGPEIDHNYRTHGRHRGSKHAGFGLDGTSMDPSTRIQTKPDLSLDRVPKSPDHTYFKEDGPGKDPNYRSHRSHKGSKHAVFGSDGFIIDPSLPTKDKIQNEPDNNFYNDDFYHTEYHNGHNNIPLPKPRSIRRKHMKTKSSSSHEDVESSEDPRIVKRISSSKKKEGKGLQILIDDDHHKKDDEEKMMDKLLLHYSKKSSNYDAEMLRKKPESSKGGGPHTRNRDRPNETPELVILPNRSRSLPHEQSFESEPQKVFARANSFQPDNQAKHVHPKLPDYDDLAARFAALKGR